MGSWHIVQSMQAKETYWERPAVAQAHNSAMHSTLPRHTSKARYSFCANRICGNLLIMWTLLLCLAVMKFHPRINTWRNKFVRPTQDYEHWWSLFLSEKCIQIWIQCGFLQYTTLFWLVCVREELCMAVVIISLASSMPAVCLSYNKRFCIYFS